MNCHSDRHAYQTNSPDFEVGNGTYYRSGDLGRGWAQKILTFWSPAIHWIARTSSVNCLSCRIPYQCLHSLNAWTPFSEKALFFTDFCFVSSPSPNSVPILPTSKKSLEFVVGPSDCRLGNSLRAKGTLISEPRFSNPLRDAIFPTRERENGLCQRKTLDNGRFPFLAWEKSHPAGGRKSGLTN